MQHKLHLINRRWKPITTNQRTQACLISRISRENNQFNFAETSVHTTVTDGNALDILIQKLVIFLYYSNRAICILQGSSLSLQHAAFKFSRLCEANHYTVYCSTLVVFYIITIPSNQYQYAFLSKVFSNRGRHLSTATRITSRRAVLVDFKHTSTAYNNTITRLI